MKAGAEVLVKKEAAATIATGTLGWAGSTATANRDAGIVVDLQQG